MGRGGLAKRHPSALDERLQTAVAGRSQHAGLHGSSRDSPGANPERLSAANGGSEWPRRMATAVAPVDVAIWFGNPKTRTSRCSVCASPSTDARRRDAPPPENVGDGCGPRCARDFVPTPGSRPSLPKATDSYARTVHEGTEGPTDVSRRRSWTNGWKRVRTSRADSLSRG